MRVNREAWICRRNCIYDWGLGVLMPGEQRVYMSSLWAGKKTAAEVFANAREAFKGVSLRIDNVKKQKAPSTAASWGEDITKLVKWRDEANKYVGNEAEFPTFHKAERQLLLTDSRQVVLKFVKDNKVDLHAQTPQVWITAVNRFVDAAGECMKVGHFIAMAEAFTIMEREFIDVTRQDRGATEQLDPWMSRMKLFFGNALTDQIDLSVKIEDMPSTNEYILAANKRRVVGKVVLLQLGRSISTYRNAVVNFESGGKMSQILRRVALERSTTSTAPATIGLTVTHALARMRGLLDAI
jgi:hypothetical protein